MTEATALSFPCACGGAGCPECRGGEAVLARCPLEFVTPDVWEAIEMAELRRRGDPPHGRGALNETAIFNDACRFIWAEQDVEEFRLKLGAT